ncbi:8-amino-7-oxononanoate synthase [Leucogyrophana mollusca]|uniref:8-amino-7-oxononanoate synthase n=1 Tax=Leucogyrophana mollusca TaxID=85980 RepID=A0ACB8BH30_9AGAM|nr:8-amino-7-oxononanoate synthase [Leucogyrophana mollusca]
MDEGTPLARALSQAIARRAQSGMTVFDLIEPLPSSAPDLFSNDYLSLTTDSFLRERFLTQISDAFHVLGSSGVRLGTGNSEVYNALERRLQRYYDAPSALVCNTGYNANVAFFGSVPQANDVIICDELIHMSCREGFRLSHARGAVYRFAHNSVTAFQTCLQDTLRKHPLIVTGDATVFVCVESLYSMDGDFSPLREIVQVVEDFVPAGHAHIVVDESHTTGTCGPDGRGYVAHLGLGGRVHTVVHTFGKGVGVQGGVILTSSLVRHYLMNFANNFIFSTSLPFLDIHAINSAFDVISGERGSQLRRRLDSIARYATKHLTRELSQVPKDVLCLNESTVLQDVDNLELCSPIIPIFTPSPRSLVEFLWAHGYGATAFTIPVVKRPRIRVIVHARNTEADIDCFVALLLQWVTEQGIPMTTSTKLINGRSVGSRL